MLTLLRTNSENEDFKKLIKLLDEGLKVTDGEDHAFYNQFNKIDTIKYVVIVYEEDTAVGCGAIKRFDNETMEIKRMFVSENQRGKGIASQILRELENWAIELDFKNCVLETGKRQVEALGVYNKNDYEVISNYGQYAGVENSVCFGKKLR